jgi:hypothetical protein
MAGYTVQAAFPSETGTPTEGKVIPNVLREVRVTGNSPWMPGRLMMIEIVRLIIPLSVAIIGLQSVAQDKLQKSELWAGALAVIAVGFGADIVKNLYASSRAR